jgi:hypothetical protein
VNNPIAHGFENRIIVLLPIHKLALLNQQVHDSHFVPDSSVQQVLDLPYKFVSHLKLPDSKADPV